MDYMDVLSPPKNIYPPWNEQQFAPENRPLGSSKIPVGNHHFLGAFAISF